MKEIVIISGKGGTGKTSICASFVALAKNVCAVDCDVDASNLHLLLRPNILETHEFRAGKEAEIIPEKCLSRGECLANCRFNAVERVPGVGFRINSINCEGCGVCVMACPTSAIKFEEVVCGEWYVSKTEHGPMVHAKLGIAAENSGKLVAKVRGVARDRNKEWGCDLIITDGPPGIGCPVISSITGANLVLAVVEPTVSGKHDLERALELSASLNVPSVVCINKWDLNPEMSAEIELELKTKNIEVVGKIAYDNIFTKAQVVGKTILEYTSDGVAVEIRDLWRRVESTINNL